MSNDALGSQQNHTANQLYKIKVTIFVKDIFIFKILEYFINQIERDLEFGERNSLFDGVKFKSRNLKFGIKKNLRIF